MEEEIFPRDYVLVVWRRRWFVVAFFLATLAATILFTFLSTPIYQAQTTLWVNVGGFRPEAADLFAQLPLSRSAVNTYVVMAKQPTVLEAAAQSLGLPPEEFGQGVKVSSIRNSEFLQIQAEDPDPRRAQEKANALAQALIKESERYQQERFRAAELSFEKRLEELAKNIDQTRAALVASQDQNQSRLLQLQLSQQESQYSILLKSMEDFQLAKARAKDMLVVFSPAEVPTSPVRPNKLMNLLIGVVLGLFLGVGAAFVVEYLDKTVKRPEDVEQRLGVPVIGTVPFFRLKEPKEAVLLFNPDSQAAGEAYRMLRTNLQFAQVGQPAKTLLVTSTGPGEGKSVTVANLGIVLAQAGKRVVLVDADLRRPSLHRLFGLPRDEGVTTLLLSSEGEADLERALQETPLEHLKVVPSGPLPPNPSELLGSERMWGLLKRLEEKADVVILDSPPLLSASDASILAATVDQVLLVVGSGEARLEAVRQAKESLERVKACLGGVVLNKVRRESGGYYYYHYY